MTIIEYVQITGVIIIYGLLSYFVIMYARKHISRSNYLTRIGLLSLIYSILFGISVWGTGGDPGFGFPTTNLISMILIIVSGRPIGIEFTFVTTMIWWLIIFIFMRVNVKKW